MEFRPGSPGNQRQHLAQIDDDAIDMAWIGDEPVRVFVAVAEMSEEHGDPAFDQPAGGRVP